MTTTPALPQYPLQNPGQASQVRAARDTYLRSVDQLDAVVDAAVAAFTGVFAQEDSLRSTSERISQIAATAKRKGRR